MKLKVLMLGWEFPPFVSGGLGIASLGLGKAIAEYTDLTLIIPRSDPEFVLEKAQLIGLNDISVDSWMRLESEVYESIIDKAEIEYLKANLFPYGLREEVYFSWEQEGMLTKAEQNASSSTNPSRNDLGQEESLSDSSIYHEGQAIEDLGYAYSHPASGGEETSSTSYYEAFQPPHQQDSSAHEQPFSGLDLLENQAEVIPFYIPDSSKEGEKQLSNPFEVSTHSSTQKDSSSDHEVTSPHTFDINQLYGEEVIQNVIDYGKFASEVALEKHFDIIHAHDWMTFLAGLELKGLTGKPLALHIHSLEYDRSGPYSRNWVYYLEKYAMEQADLIIPVSAYSSEIIQQYYEIDPLKISPVHNGMEIPEVKRIPKPFPESLIVFLGRITEQKGPQFFLQMALKVLNERNDVRFVMAGQGNMLPELIRKVAEHGIGDRFHFTGFLQTDKVRELLGMADVFVMPSVSEPFGLAAVEAAHSGVPCVISKQAGASEVLKGALLADYWDSDKLARHVLSLLDDPELTEQVVTEMQEQLEVSWDNAAKKVLDAYKLVLESN